MHVYGTNVIPIKEKKKAIFSYNLKLIDFCAMSSELSKIYSIIVSEVTKSFSKIKKIHKR